jgi:hypothetical protein
MDRLLSFVSWFSLMSPVGVGTATSPNFNAAAEAVASGPTTGDALLLESGDFLLLESGDYLLLE